MTSAALRAELEHRCREEQFDAIAFAAAAPLERDGAALQRWLDSGHQATMQWIERDPEQRADPRKLLPGCRTVIALAMNYWPGVDAAQPLPEQARVALYAQSRDYHKVMGKKLKRLAAWLDETCGSTTRSCVDTSPVLERGWAQRAGLGWIGKNGNLLTTSMGSWLLLGELLTTADLPLDDGPHADHCGTCTACIDACPTDAIIADGVIDSRRCISYWTIEHRGSIPEQQRAGNGEWIFGCDICQDVCPWNTTHARAVDPSRFERRDDLRSLDAVEILRMNETTFRERYSGTPLMRAKWEGMRRNACIVLASSLHPQADEALREALDDDDAVVAEHAAWALSRRGGVP